MSTVLIADDNRSIREFCRGEFEDEGYDVLIAHNGAEAVALASQFVPDLVVLDVCMPGMNGLEALTRIKRHDPEMAVVLFTAFDDACLKDGRALQANACVDKSHDLSELKQVVSNALRSKRNNSTYRRGLPPVSFAANQTQ
jgi:CheY-like chemotaxis protein